MQKIFVPCVESKPAIPHIWIFDRTCGRNPWVFQESSKNEVKKAKKMSAMTATVMKEKNSTDRRHVGSQNCDQHAGDWRRVSTYVFINIDFDDV